MSWAFESRLQHDQWQQYGMQPRNWLTKKDSGAGSVTLYNLLAVVFKGDSAACTPGTYVKRMFLRFLLAGKTIKKTRQPIFFLYYRPIRWRLSLNESITLSMKYSYRRFYRLSTNHPYSQPGLFPIMWTIKSREGPCFMLVPTGSEAEVKAGQWGWWRTMETTDFLNTHCHQIFLFTLHCWPASAYYRTLFESMTQWSLSGNIISPHLNLLYSDYRLMPALIPLCRRTFILVYDWN